jgi:ATP synthase assembly factor FMC1, mitochondrial
MVDIVPFQARSLYRALLRELPRRALSSPSPLKLRIRRSFSPSITAGQGSDVVLSRIQQAEQFVRYAQAQRMHTVLLERYNPGIGIDNLDQDERIRLTARRVGMELPTESKREEGG